jgi:hypothetical protein
LAAGQDRTQTQVEEVGAFAIRAARDD